MCDKIWYVKLEPEVPEIWNAGTPISYLFSLLTFVYYVDLCD